MEVNHFYRRNVVSSQLRLAGDDTRDGKKEKQRGVEFSNYSMLDSKIHSKCFCV